MNRDFSVAPEFCIPFGYAHLQNPDQLNIELKQLFLERELQGEVYRNVGALVDQPSGLFESHFTLFEWPESCVQTLREFCWRSLYRLIGDLNGYDVGVLSRLKIRAEAWFHVTRNGGYFGLHNHPNSAWSGVYCVDSGQSSVSDTLNGVLQFANPMLSTTSYVDMANARLRGRYAAGVRNLKLVPGQLVLFPSWLPHQVLPFIGSGERITVAFNAQFKLDGPLPELR